MANWQLIATAAVQNTANINIAQGFFANNAALNQLLIVITPNAGQAFSLSFDGVTINPGQPSPLVPQINIQYPCAALSADFEGTIANQVPGVNVVTWAWDFGDGTTANGQNVSHTYAAPGTYPVCLTITDNCQRTRIVQQNVTLPAYSIAVTPTPMIACKDGIGQIRYELNLQGGSGNGNETFPVNLQATVTGASGVIISGVEFNVSGSATVQAPIDGTATIANLELSIPNSVPIGTVLTIQLTYTVCGIEGVVTSTLTVQDCGEFTCPCSGPNAYNIDATILANSKLSTSILPQNGLTNACLAIRGSFQIDKDYSISGGEIRMQPGASINISRDAINDPALTVSIDHVQENGGIHGCTDLWSGIYIFTGETLNFTHNIISDAHGALGPKDKSNVHISRNIFDNNDWGIHVNGIGAPQLVVPNAILNYNTFTSTSQLLLNGNKPSGGIWVRNGFLSVGPSDSPQGPWNKFTRLKTGIDVETGAVGVGQALMSEFDMTNPPARGIHAGNASLLITYSSISDATEAINIDGPVLLAYENVLTNAVHAGIISEPSWLAQIERNNQLINCSRPDGVALWVSGGNGSLRINNNTIYSDGNQFSGRMVTALNITANNPFDYSEVKDNTILFSTAIPDWFQTGIKINQSNKQRVYGNTIEIPSNSAGIWVKDVKNSRFKENSVSWNSNFADAISRYGVISQMSDLNRYCCNQFFDLDFGLRYDGPCGANDIRHNEVNDGSIGITCTSATVLGEQVHAGNLWNGFAAQHFGTGFEKQNSKFWIQDGDFSMPGIQKTPPFWPQQPSDADFIDFLLGTASDCATDNTCLPPFFPEYAGEGEEDLNPIKPSDVSTSRKIYQGQEYGDMLNWELQRELLIRLKTHEELIGTNTSVDSFYYAIEGSNLDKFTDIEIAIDNIAKINPSSSIAGFALIDSISRQFSSLKTLDSLLILLPEGEASTLAKSQRKLCLESIGLYNGVLMALEAQLKIQRDAVLDDLIVNNALIVSNNTIETNLKQVNGLYLQLLKKERFEITEGEAIAIKSIADQCPLEGGKAVLRARILYNMHQMVYNDIEESTCGTQGNRLVERKEATVDETPNQIFRIQPNPTSGLIHILSLENDFLGQPVRVEIFNLTGVLIETQSFTLSGDNIFDLEHLSNGIYELRLTTQGGFLQTHKLILAK